MHLKEELDFLEDLKKSGKEVGGMVKMIEREVRKGVKGGEAELFQRKLSKHYFNKLDNFSIYILREFLYFICAN